MAVAAAFWLAALFGACTKSWIAAGMGRRSVGELLRIFDDYTLLDGSSLFNVQSPIYLNFCRRFRQEAISLRPAHLCHQILVESSMTNF